FEFIDGVFNSLRYLQNLGYKLVIITNQSGIGRGYYSNLEYEKLTKWMVNKFKDNSIDILSVFCCPHTPEDNCKCRKPNIGMIEQTKNVIDINFKSSWLIGDKTSDIELAINVDIPNTVQVLSGNKFDIKKSKAKYIIKSIKDIKSIIKS
ncbi:MAG: HAD-IIIA family hydrolase, partial [Campylobacterota bacterium]|nr:HAD-IIIA family hydrolase [Campylobacterota bacterium]